MLAAPITLSLWLLLSHGACAQEPNPRMQIATAKTMRGSGDILGFEAAFHVRILDRSHPDFDHQVKWNETDHLTWQGSTQVDFTLTYAGQPDSAGLSLHISTVGCEDPRVDHSNQAYPGDGTTNNFIVRLTDETNTIAEQHAGPGVAVVYSIPDRDWVIDLSRAKCLVLKEEQDGAAQGNVWKAPIVPTEPEWPESWHAVIEASITNKGYTFTMHESFDAECNVVRQDFWSADRGHVRSLQDYGNKVQWFVLPPNSTYPDGKCVKRDMEPGDSELFRFSDSGSGVAGTKHFLAFINSEGTQAEFTSDQRDRLVRGTPVDVWQYGISVNTGNVTAKYDVDFSFSHPAWHFGYSTGHRDLQRIELTGDVDRDGQNYKVYHVYDFIDFRGSIPDWVTFEPCQMLPGGEDCDCIDVRCSTKESAEQYGISSVDVAGGDTEVDHTHGVAYFFTWLGGFAIATAVWLLVFYFVGGVSLCNLRRERGAGPYQKDELEMPTSMPVSSGTRRPSMTRNNPLNDVQVHAAEQ